VLGIGLELLLAESLRLAYDTGALRGKDLKRVTVDTTVRPKGDQLPERCQAFACGDQGSQPPGDQAWTQAVCAADHRFTTRLAGQSSQKKLFCLTIGT